MAKPRQRRQDDHASFKYVPHDGRVDLQHLTALAEEFDGLSQKAGEWYPAGEFITWLKREAAGRGKV